VPKFNILLALLSSVSVKASVQERRRVLRERDVEFVRRLMGTDAVRFRPDSGGSHA
jgi:hypothetical protein